MPPKRVSKSPVRKPAAHVASKKKTPVKKSPAKKAPVKRATHKKQSGGGPFDSVVLWSKAKILRNPDAAYKYKIAANENIIRQIAAKPNGTESPEYKFYTTKNESLIADQKTWTGATASEKAFLAAKASMDGISDADYKFQICKGFKDLYTSSLEFMNVILSNDYEKSDPKLAFNTFLTKLTEAIDTMNVKLTVDDETYKEKFKYINETIDKSLIGTTVDKVIIALPDSDPRGDQERQQRAQNVARNSEQYYATRNARRLAAAPGSDPYNSVERAITQRNTKRYMEENVAMRERERENARSAAANPPLRAANRQRQRQTAEQAAAAAAEQAAEEQRQAYEELRQYDEDK
jgi:hypothetical protein